MASGIAASSKGIEGKVDQQGKVSHPGVKAVVVYQPDVSDDPLPFGYFGSEEDAREYIKQMKASGQGIGLRIVKQ